MISRTVVDICNRALVFAGINQQISDINAADPTSQACNVQYDECRVELLNEFRWPFAIKRFQLVPLAGPAYDKTVNYAAQAYVQYGKNLYQSLLANNLNNQPDLAASAAWWKQITRDGFNYACQLPDDCITEIAVWPQRAASLVNVFDDELRTPRSTQRVPFSIENLGDAGDTRLLLTDAINPMFKYVGDVSNPTRFPVLFAKALALKMAAGLAMALRGDEKKAQSCELAARVALNAAFVSELRQQQEDDEPISEFEAVREGDV